MCSAGARRGGTFVTAARIVAAASLFGCTDARLITLGHQGAGEGGTAGIGGEAGQSAGGARNRPLLLGEARRIQELIPAVTTDLKQDNPTLNKELTELYFTSNRPGSLNESADVWVSRRATRNDPWGEPEHLGPLVNTDEDDSSPAVSLDGQKLWVGIDRTGGLGDLDIWELTRGSASPTDWINPTNVRALNSSAKDIPRQPGFGDLIMPLNSQRDEDGKYYMYFARRPSPNEPFSPLLEPQDALNVAGQNTTDGFLTADGLRLFFNGEPKEGLGNLIVAYRNSLSEAFTREDVEPLTALNGTMTDERDPWLSPDGTELYYATDRPVDGDDGFLTIWVAKVLP